MSPIFKLSRESKKLRTNLRKLLKSRDLDVFVQGCELLGGLARDAQHRVIVEELAQGCRLDDAHRPVIGDEVIARCTKASEAPSRNLLLALWSLHALGRLDDHDTLVLKDCPLLTLTALPYLTHLTSLDLAGCTSLTGLQGLDRLAGLTSLRIYHARFATLEGIDAVPGLRVLRLDTCQRLVDVRDLASLPQLTELHTSSCDRMEGDVLRQLTTLRVLEVNYDIAREAIGALTQLTDLTLCWTDRLQDLTPFTSLTNLRTLHLTRNGVAKDVALLAPLASLPQLERLSLRRWKRLTNLDGLTCLPQLTQLDLRYCDDLTDVSGLASLTALRHLDLSRCERASDIGAISRLTQLRTLDVSRGPSLDDGQMLAPLTELRSLSASGSNLTTTRHLAGLSRLTDLQLYFCDQLRTSRVSRR